MLNCVLFYIYWTRIIVWNWLYCREVFTKGRLKWLIRRVGELTNAGYHIGLGLWRSMSFCFLILSPFFIQCIFLRLVSPNNRQFPNISISSLSNSAPIHYWLTKACCAKSIGVQKVQKIREIQFWNSGSASAVCITYWCSDAHCAYTICTLPANRQRGLTKIGRNAQQIVIKVSNCPLAHQTKKNTERGITANSACSLNTEPRSLQSETIT